MVGSLGGARSPTGPTCCVTLGRSLTDFKPLFPCLQQPQPPQLPLGSGGKRSQVRPLTMQGKEHRGFRNVVKTGGRQFTSIGIVTGSLHPCWSQPCRGARTQGSTLTLAPSGSPPPGGGSGPTDRPAPSHLSGAEDPCIGEIARICGVLQGAGGSQLCRVTGAIAPHGVVHLSLPANHTISILQMKKWAGKFKG